VGDDLAIHIEDEKYERTVRFVLPPERTNGGDAAPRAEEPIDAKPQGGQLTATLENVATSGIYSVQLQPVQGEVENRQIAVNVTAGEGDLAIEPREELKRQLAGVEFELHDAADMALNARQIAGFQMSDALLAILIVALVAEQLFAYMASYHVAPLRGATR
jgi:hypothetical protein